MSDVEKLSTEKVSELVTSDASEFKDKVSDTDLSVESLKELKKAEAAGQDREEILKFIDSKINAGNVAVHLGTAKDDVAELEEIIEFIEEVEDIENFEKDSIEIDQNTLIDLVGGTVKELKKFVSENSLTAEQIDNILNAESKVKDRKTAKSFLEAELRKRKMAQDTSKVKEDIDSLKHDLKELEEDSDAENIDLSPNSENVEDSKESPEEKSEEEEDEQEKDESENTVEQEHERNRKNESSEKVADSEEEELDSEDDNLEEKRDIAEELGLDISDKDLEKFSVEDLHNVLGEKKHRTDLIDFLKGKGLEKSTLKASSTKDLEKIAEGFEDEDKKEDHEEMREEAEEDLEMLMGAVRGKNNEEEDEEDAKDTREKLSDLKESITEKLNRNSGDETASDGIDPGQVSEVLDQYSNLGDEEAAVKTAHVMKGFLEQSLAIEREMTYKELAENMPVDDNEDVEALAEFFLKMHREQYTGQFSIEDVDSTIDICENVLETLS